MCLLVMLGETFPAVTCPSSSDHLGIWKFLGIRKYFLEQGTLLWEFSHRDGNGEGFPTLENTTSKVSEAEKYEAPP